MRVTVEQNQKHAYICRKYTKKIQKQRKSQTTKIFDQLKLSKSRNDTYAKSLEGHLLILTNEIV